MMIENDTVVTFHYDLHRDGNLIESSRNGNPVACLLGAGNVIPGIEAAIKGHQKGDQIDVTISPDQAYGERKEGMQQRVPAKYLKHAGKLKPGMAVTVNTDNGPRSVTVIKVGLKSVDIDGNHPLAGATLRFVIDIDDVRAASAEEKAHGHAHGPGGHHH